MPTHFTLLSLFVKDLPRMQAFYTERVGLEVVPQLSNPADFIFLNADGTPLARSRPLARWNSPSRRPISPLHGKTGWIMAWK